MLTGRQVRESRKLLRWGAIRFTRITGIPQTLLEAVESTDGVAWLTDAQEKAFRSAFEAAGIEFISDVGDGAGVRLRKAEKGEAICDGADLRRRRS